MSLNPSGPSSRIANQHMPPAHVASLFGGDPSLLTLFHFLSHLLQPQGFPHPLFPSQAILTSVLPFIVGTAGCALQSLLAHSCWGSPHLYLLTLLAQLNVPAIKSGEFAPLFSSPPTCSAHPMNIDINLNYSYQT